QRSASTKATLTFVHRRTDRPRRADVLESKTRSSRRTGSAAQSDYPSATLTASWPGSDIYGTADTLLKDLDHR
ncbi:MAG: hypothetical protein Q8R82_18725, partial [Hyphomonadaceae bacterium]|nr:hypothetical protein [Hyphomonadaceae bacterium]